MRNNICLMFIALGAMLYEFRHDIYYALCSPTFEVLPTAKEVNDLFDDL